MASTVETLGKWQVGKLLGEGGFSQVRLGTHEKTGELAALKILHKKSGDSRNASERKQVETEIDAMKKIQHKNVLQMKDFDMNLTFRDKEVILIVLELAPGGELFEYLSFTGAFSEIVTRTYFHQLMYGIQAAHKVDICHRDLKPENLLMDADFQLKIADFGFAHAMQQGNLYTECGTTGYMAPEMFRSKGTGYDGEKTDVWAAAVVLFIMKAGFPPYQAPKRSDWWFHKLMNGRYDRFWMAHTRSATFSDELRDLINKMFTSDPDNRIGVEDIINHKWFKGKTLDAGEMKKQLSQRKAVIDKENAKLREKQEEEQGVAGYGAGAVRAIGEEDGSEEEAASDELPDGTPGSIILAMGDEDKKDTGEEEEEEEEDLDGTGMEDMSMQDTEDEKKEEASVYNPPKINYTKFECKADPDTTHDVLKEVFGKLKIKYTMEGYALHGSLETLSGPNLTFVAEVFKHAKDDDLSVVEFTRGKGDPGTYRNVYAKVRNKMDTLAREAIKS